MRYTHDIFFISTNSTGSGNIIFVLLVTCRLSHVTIPLNPIFMNQNIAIVQWLIDPDKRQKLPADWEFLEKKLKEYGLEEVLNKIELPLVKILEEMHEAGIKTDRGLLEKLSRKFNEEIGDLEKEIYKQAGANFNLNSPKQLSGALFEKLKIDTAGVFKTKKGVYSTNVENLLTIQNRHPIVAFVLKYRELFKIKSTYIEPLRELTGEDGRVHTTFIQTGTATGRLSSQNPNLQNIPASIRNVFIADEGYKLVSFDYSQVELRVLASVTEDPKMLDAFRKDTDIHVLTASQVFNVDIQKVTKEQRKLAKTLNFGVIYGMGANAFARNTGLSRKEAEKFINEYFDDFAEIKRWQEKLLEKVRQVGYVENLNGRKRWLYGINDQNPRIASAYARAAINMPIQGLAADIIKLAMIKIHDLLLAKKWRDSNPRNSKVRMLLSIHDELLFEIKDDLIDEAIPLIKSAMESAYQLKVALKVEAALGNNWGKLSSKL